MKSYIELKCTRQSGEIAFTAEYLNMSTAKDAKRIIEESRPDLRVELMQRQHGSQEG